MLPTAGAYNLFLMQAVKDFLRFQQKNVIMPQLNKITVYLDSMRGGLAMTDYKATNCIDRLTDRLMG